MPPEPHTFVTYAELTGQKSELEEFRTKLALFSRPKVLQACSVINSLLNSWKGNYDMKSHDRLVLEAFEASFAKKLISLKRVIFHRQQLLFVAKEACRLCPDNGRDTQNRFWGGLGIVLLMANDHLDIPAPSGKTAEEYRLGIVLQMMPSIEASHFHQYQLKMMRSYLMLSKFVESRRGSNLFFDVSRLFEERTKIPLVTYQALIFATLSRFTNLDVDKYLTNPSLFDITEKWFESTGVPKEQISAFLSDISATGDDFAEKYAAGHSSPNDFTYLKDRPFYRFGNTLYPIDFSFVAEKFESGPFWRVNEVVDNADRSRFHSFWGQIFEDYINWIFSQTVNPLFNSFYPSPMYDIPSGGQVCDGIIVSDGAAILMEYKGSTFTAKSKYGTDIEPLRKEMEEKLIGTESHPKGIRQLANAALSILARSGARKIKGLDLSGTTRVIPLLITRDDVGSSFGTNAYLNLRFRSLLGAQRKRLTKTVTPLFCVSADDIEKVSNHLADTSLTRILESRYKGDPHLMLTLFTGRNSTLDRLELLRPAIHMNANEEFKKEMLKVLQIKSPHDGR